MLFHVSSCSQSNVEGQRYISLLKVQLKFRFSKRKPKLNPGLVA